ncbi:hypothetical protein [Pseudomonas typographi]|uniref:Uncharacterized protein n=1 Tax=Pseudomonas typographi TaxID=2715964 RepID=A0ABR7Z2L1_9PSED|nr:hypothetical protein [Pseudomonas typographi]MBD1585904.1 hypothetical protein [Pseudomonas typographi]MBD1599730.1 hypothetical protein [Pseudomonas typographi]
MAFSRAATGPEAVGHTLPNTGGAIHERRSPLCAGSRRIAPAYNKALYFGAGEVKQIGFFLGPLPGGVLFTAGGSHLLINACALWIALAAVALYQVHVLLRGKSALSTTIEPEPTNR